jgi:hypothetical protein
MTRLALTLSSRRSWLDSVRPQCFSVRSRLRVFETGPKKPETQRFENRLSRVIF